MIDDLDDEGYFVVSFESFLKHCNIEMLIVDVDEQSVSDNAKKHWQYHCNQARDLGLFGKRWFDLKIKNLETNKTESFYIFDDNEIPDYSICDKLVYSASWALRDNFYILSTQPYSIEIYEKLKKVLDKSFPTFLHILSTDKSSPAATKQAVTFFPETDSNTIRILLVDSFELVREQARRHPKAADWIVFT